MRFLYTFRDPADHLTAVMHQRGRQATSEQRHEIFQSLLRVSSFSTLSQANSSTIRRRETHRHVLRIVGVFFVLFLFRFYVVMEE